MGFASGAVSYRRFYITGKCAEASSASWREGFAKNAFGEYGSASSDGVEVGWIVPDHLFDVDFSDASRITFGRYLFAAMRMDRILPPAQIVKSYRRMEEVAALNASGKEFLSKSEKREAKEAADQRADEEARRGAFRRTAGYPLLIDTEKGIVYFGQLGSKSSDKLMILFADTFDTTLVPAHAEETAFRLVQKLDLSRKFDDVIPMRLVDPPMRMMEGDTDSQQEHDRAFLGREMLTWLWFVASQREGALTLANSKEVGFALHQMLELTCVFDLTGKDSIRTDAPSTAPEALAAMRVGKQPTKAGLLLAARGLDASLNLDGATGNVSGLKLPQPEEPLPPRDLLEYRFDAIRETSVLLDEIYAAFLKVRLSDGFRDELREMKNWALGSHDTLESLIRRASA